VDPTHLLLTPLATAPSSPRMPGFPQTAQEYLLQRKYQQQQQHALALAAAAAAALPPVRKNKRKQPTPIKSPKRPDCLEQPPGIVFVFPTWLDSSASSSSSSSSSSSLASSSSSRSGTEDLDDVDVDVEEDGSGPLRRKRPTMRLNSSDFVVLVHPTTDKLLLAAVNESSRATSEVPVEQPQPVMVRKRETKQEATLKQAPPSQDDEDETGLETAPVSSAQQQQLEVHKNGMVLLGGMQLQLETGGAAVQRERMVIDERVLMA